jgi:hypothetical protein
MNDRTNIAQVTTDEDFTELYCISCAEELFQGLPNVEIEQRYTWENNEADSPNHCPNCGVLLEQDMTDAGLEYIRAEIVKSLSDGNAMALDEESAAYAWHQRYGDQVKADLLTSEQRETLDEILDPEQVLAAYFECLLRTGTLDFMTGTEEQGGEALISDSLLDSVASVADLPEEIRSEAVTDVDSFLDQVSEYLHYWQDLPEALTASQLGHDFCLTRNHHGAGFWDRGYGEIGSWLTRISHAMGSHNIYGAVILRDPDLPPAAVLEKSNLDLSTLHIWQSS